MAVAACSHSYVAHNMYVLQLEQCHLQTADGRRSLAFIRHDPRFEFGLERVSDLSAALSRQRRRAFAPPTRHMHTVYLHLPSSHWASQLVPNTGLFSKTWRPVATLTWHQDGRSRYSGGGGPRFARKDITLFKWPGHSGRPESVTARLDGGCEATSRSAALCSFP